MEIIKSNLEERGTKKESREFKELEYLPESVRDLFDKLPDSAKIKIFSKGGESLPQKTQEERLREMVAGFDAKTREEFMENALSRLFEYGILDYFLKRSGVNNLKEKTMEFMEILWQNRGKEDKIRLCGEDYYSNFFTTRKNLMEAIKIKKSEIEKFIVSRKKLSTRKEGERQMLQSQIDMLEDALSDWDKKNGNTDLDHWRYRDVSSRQKREKLWTEAVALLNEYFTAAEFATSIAEQLDRTFRKEVLNARAPEKWYGKKPSPEEVEESKKIAQSLEKAVEEWYERHKNEGALKKPIEMKSAERQNMLVDYFKALFDSYMKGKESKKSDEQMNAEIRQMEVTLNILGKLSGH